MSEGLVRSALDWWAEAGVDTLVDELPRDWLAKVSPPLASPTAPAEVARPDAPPAALGAFRQWLLTDPQVPGPPHARHDAAGDPAAGCMVVLDMPEAGDRGAQRLLTGEAGELFDRMLGAIGLSRETLYLAPFAPARPATGKLGDTECTTLARLMRHHIALVAPKRLLLLGDAPVCALAGEAVAKARGRTLSIETPKGTVAAIASFPPRLVRGTELRRWAWDDLQAFRELA